MASDLNLPESLYEDYSTPDHAAHGTASVPYWIQALQSRETKERALLILSQVFFMYKLHTLSLILFGS